MLIKFLCIFLIEILFTTTCETKLLKTVLFSFIKDSISGCRNILQSRSSELLLSGEIRNASNTRRKDDKCLSVFSLITDDLLCRIWSRRLVEIYSCSSKTVFFIHNTRFIERIFPCSIKKIDICEILRDKINLIYYFNFDLHVLSYSFSSFLISCSSCIIPYWILTLLILYISRTRRLAKSQNQCAEAAFSLGQLIREII